MDEDHQDEVDANYIMEEGQDHNFDDGLCIMEEGQYHNLIMEYVSRRINLIQTLKEIYIMNPHNFS